MRDGLIPLVAILAGGKSSRMGEDKAELLISGIPIIERVWGRVSKIAKEVVVVGGTPKLDYKGVKTIGDAYVNAGSLGGIATALDYCRRKLGDEGHVLCIACDMPFIKEALLMRLWELRVGCDVVVPKTQKGYEPLCALYGVGCLQAMLGQISLGDLKIQHLFQKVRAEILDLDELRKIDPELTSFTNINDPGDLSEARNQAAAMNFELSCVGR
ncbi:MAG: hypothetical protein C0608_11150 [Deltaproteobacteria bacterium]|nr:MAG: hypothetical protein C0608_11150 [Deltaproteobacteria bacterium]